MCQWELQNTSVPDILSVTQDVILREIVKGKSVPWHKVVERIITEFRLGKVT